MLRAARLLLATAILALALGLAAAASALTGDDEGPVDAGGEVIEVGAPADEPAAAAVREGAPPSDGADDGALIWWLVVTGAIGVSVLVAWHGVAAPGGDE